MIQTTIMDYGGDFKSRDIFLVSGMEELHYCIKEENVVSNSNRHIIIILKENREEPFDLIDERYIFSSSYGPVHKERI